MNDYPSWLGLETGHLMSFGVASVRWGLTLPNFLWQGAIIGLLALVAGFLEIEYEDKDAATRRADAQPFADGTHLVTDIITNPGTLLSAHLANEEIRQRDFRNASEQEQ